MRRILLLVSVAVMSTLFLLSPVWARGAEAAVNTVEAEGASLSGKSVRATVDSTASGAKAVFFVPNGRASMQVTGYLFLFVGLPVQVFFSPQYRFLVYLL